MAQITLKANINECTVEGWQSNTGEVNARVMSVEMSEDLLTCDKQFVTFELADGTVYESLVADGKVKIPIFEKPQFIKIGVYAENINGDECEKRYSAHPANQYVTPGSFKGKADEQPKPTPGDYAELLGKIEDIENSGGGGSVVDLDILTEVDPTEEHTNEQLYGAKALDEMSLALEEILQDVEGRKQDTLVSGENIKKINGESLLGSGNISIAGNSGGSANNKVFERIATVTVVPDENGDLPTKISITADDNGNPFELTDVYCDVLIGLTDGSTGRFYVSVGNPSERNMISVIGNATLNINNTQLRKWCFRVDNYGDGRGGLTSAPSVSLVHTADFPSANVSTMYGQPIPVWRTIDIREVQFVGQAGNTQTFMEGTTITLWGVRKQ